MSRFTPKHNWDALLPELAEAGVSMMEFARRKGIPYGTLYLKVKAEKKKAAKRATRAAFTESDCADVTTNHTGTRNCPIVRTIESDFWINNPKTQRLKLYPHQKRILNAMFAETSDGKLRYSTYVYSCVKKSGKTAIAAAVTQAFAKLYGGEMYSIANDREGAKNRMFDRVTQSLRLMREHDPETFDRIMIEDKKSRERIAINGVIEFAECGQRNPGPHTIRYIAQDAAGEAGSMMACCTFDELWGVSSERGERLWTEFQPIPVIPVSIRLVTTYAGFYGESELLWRLYDNVCKPDPHTSEEMGRRLDGLEDLPIYVSDDDSTIVYWDHEARMPWHTEEFLEQARNDPSMQGRESEYRRLWHNEWSSGVEAFIDMEYVDRAIAAGLERGVVNNMSEVLLGV